MDLVIKNLNRKTLVTIALISLLSEVWLVLIAGLELFKILVVSSFLILSISIIIEPYFGFFILLIITNFIEGKLLENFFLFKLFGFHWYLMDLIFFAMLLSTLFRFLSGEYEIKYNTLFFWLTVFLLVCFFGAFWGLKMGNEPQAVFFDLRSFFYYMIFIPVIFLLKDFNKLKRLFYFLILIGVLKSIIDSYLSIFVYLPTYDSSSLIYLPFARLTGYSEVVYPLTLVGSLTYLFFTKDLNIRVTLLIFSIFSVIALFLSYTRGSWYASIITVLLGAVILLYSKRIKFNIVFTIAIILFIAVITPFLVITKVIPLDIIIDRVTSVTLHKIDISNLGRLVEYATAFSFFLGNPVLGAGLGISYNYYTPGIGYQSTIYTHNSYLYVLSKMGLLGFVPFIITLYYAFIVGVRVCKSRRFSDEETGIVFSFSMMFAFLLFKSFTTWHLNTVTFSLFIGFLLGIFILYANKIKEK